MFLEQTQISQEGLSNRHVFQESSIKQKQPPRRFSKISVLFFQEQPFYNHNFHIFQEGPFIWSSNRHEFSRRVYKFFEQTQIFQEGLSKKHVFLRRFYLSVCRTDLIISSNRY